MDVSTILNQLNEAQREAVSASPGNYLVLAGAGSGKTRVLVHRIAWLIQVNQLLPQQIMAVTFTNKAAAEMRQRALSMLEHPSPGMWIGTFHGLAHRLLRQHWQEANLEQNFQVLDADDQLRLIKRTQEALAIDEAKFPSRRTQWQISAWKDDGLRPQHIDHKNDPFRKQLILTYQTYQDTCERSNLVDFSELLLRAYELLKNNEMLLSHYKQRFRHVLIDEFQDTNNIQYAWISLFAGEENYLFAVGDDDQSIYSWRGAKVSNMQQFQQDFSGCQLIKLEQNYRSTQTILKAANQLISNNNERLGKELWTEAKEGEVIDLFAAYNEHDEARFVISTIQKHKDEGVNLSCIAILYRSNAQSRLFEEALISNNIPYQVYGGFRFFERAEIKDVLAYLRLVANADDDAAFNRVINTPTRGIGQQTLNQIRVVAKDYQLSLWQALLKSLEQNLLPPKAQTNTRLFIELINQIKAKVETYNLSDLIDYTIRASDLPSHYQKEAKEKAESRLENLAELINAAKEFCEYNADIEDNQGLLTAFLTNASLEAGDMQTTDNEGIQLMTLHSAKGLEFPIVFLCGMEEGLFPHKRSIEESGQLEEERRLCYVGITRAQQKLYLSYAESRKVHGVDNFQQRSRFIHELPTETINEIRPRINFSRPISNVAPKTNVQNGQNSYPVRLGQTVKHKRFGEGIVLNIEGIGAHARAQINFHDAGTKWLVLAYANLSPIREENA